MDNPAVIALIITYRRLDLAIETIRSVKRHVQYPNIGFHIADDGSGPEYVKRLCYEIGPTYSITLTDSARGGVGKNMNLGIEACLSRSDFWLHLEDDWALKGPIDLTPCVRLLAEDKRIGMVRLGRLSAGIKAVSYSGAGQMWWLMERKSDTYVFSGNAALRHRRFSEFYGPYRTGLHPGQTELTYCGHFNHKVSGPEIVWPAWLNTDQTFHHIGDHQSFKYYMEREGLTGEQAAEKFARMGTAQ